MAKEQTFVTEYRVETVEVVPLISALEALSEPEVRVTRWWKLLVPGQAEPVDVTSRAKLAEGWCRLGGVAAHYDEVRVVPRGVEAVELDQWRKEIRAWAEGEKLTWGSEDGHVDAYAGYVAVKTPSRLGQSEHMRRRRAVEAVLRGHEMEYTVECITQHSDNVCRPLFADTQEQLAVEPVTVGANGGGP